MLNSRLNHSDAVGQKPMRKVACCYWEGGLPPAYLAWCASSWIPFFNLDEVLFLNQSNIHRYLGDLVDTRDLRRYSFAKQSDIVSAAYLYKYGGVFLDIDTILVNVKALDFLRAAETETAPFTYFGNAANNGVHIGVLASPAKGRVVEAWQNALFRRVPEWRNDKSWSYVGNELLEPLIFSEEYRGASRVIDVKESMATPEMIYARPGLKTARERYEDYWFSPAGEGDPSISHVLEDSHGIICLHNSWTPAAYMDKTAAELNGDSSRLSDLLRRVGDLDSVEGLRERVHLGD